MNPTRAATRFVLPLAAVIVIACTGTGPGWTFAPLGPSPAPTPSGGPTAAPTSSTQPALTLQVKTTQAAPTSFDPTTLEAPADTFIQVDYLNDSNVQHNIEFFDSADETGNKIGETEIVTGPGNTQSTQFTTPATAGSYYFWCLVHGDSMSGTLNVTAQ